MIAGWLWLGCPRSEPADPDEPGCASADCVRNLASGAWYGPEDEAKVGDTLASWRDLVLVGAPVYLSGEYTDVTTFVRAFSLPGLQPRGVWFGADGYDLTGAAIAVTDLGDDGVPDIAIGQPNGHPRFDVDGAVYLVHGVPDGELLLEEAATLQFRTPRNVQVGNSVRFGSILGTGTVDLVACGLGLDITDSPGTVYAIDPERTGILGEQDAERILRGPAGFGYHLALWDADLDGQQDLVVADGLRGVSWFRGPWRADVTAKDRDGFWAVGPQTDSIGDALEALGDLTGDGTADLGFTSLTHMEPFERAGRAYLVAGGQAGGGSVEDIALQVHGSSVGEGMGSAIASGDLDGDGQQDLLLGASGVYPGIGPGYVLLFLGPLGEGTLSRDDADAVMHGENPHDFLGRSLAAVDADGDAQDDLVVGATGWPSDRYRGAVYLVHGSDWLH